MTRSIVLVSLLVLAMVAVPLAASAVTEPKTKTEYPDRVTVAVDGRDVVLVATGVGLREKTVAKVDVYTIVSYVSGEADLGADPGAALRSLDVPKRIQLNLRREVGREKLLASFRGGIERNFADTSPFADDLARFEALFDRDAREGDRIVFEYLPSQGLVIALNDEVLGTIENRAFVEALWTVWFGEKPANDGLKRSLLSALPQP
ncbi:MAG TPA: chalcone isomerase family protein [Candidatus Krumholzibacteria bacterium]|nr:chalcone isomerase family protein [Candidatus Krumholzibacteria bacterium]HPD73053.1 chalcone isomerase family protein [Candidatus Krumholzibacteria bacterium]HRY41853.1 chalcone isomerase family protein [Candidatus Krumholzibacteria bacterium]